MTSCFQFLKDGSLHGVTYVSRKDWIKLFFSARVCHNESMGLLDIDMQ